MKIVKRNGEPLFKTITPRTRLKFSIGVIVANFILGIICMLIGGDLTALGVFLAMANSPLYVYVLGQSFAPTQIPDSYYNQSHGGAGGLGTIIKSQSTTTTSNTSSSSVAPTDVSNDPVESSIQTQSKDDYNIPIGNTIKPVVPVKVINKNKSEIG